MQPQNNNHQQTADQQDQSQQQHQQQLQGGCPPPLGQGQQYLNTSLPQQHQHQQFQQQQQQSQPTMEMQQQQMGRQTSVQSHNGGGAEDILRQNNFYSQQQQPPPPQPQQQQQTTPTPMLQVPSSQNDNLTDDSIHCYKFDHQINALAFRNITDDNVTVAVGSMSLERANNKVEILRLTEATTTSNEQPQQPQTTKRLVKVSEFPHEFPPSKLMWEPIAEGQLLASAGEFVQIWMVKQPQTKLLCDVKQQSLGGAIGPYDAPVTCFDWSPNQTNMLAVAQLNGISAVWDLYTMQNQQIIAHESQVNSITFTTENNQFVTGGQDGQVRFFDLRNLQTSTIIYQQGCPILQALLNRVNQYQLALVLDGSSDVVILDIRNASHPMTRLHHAAQINYAAWFPNQNLISTTSDDGMTKIFDLSNSAVIGDNAHMSQPVQEPKCYQYVAESPVNQICWSDSQPNKWLGMTLDTSLQLLKF